MEKQQRLSDWAINSIDPGDFRSETHLFMRCSSGVPGAKSILCGIAWYGGDPMDYK